MTVVLNHANSFPSRSSGVFYSVLLHFACHQNQIVCVFIVLQVLDFVSLIFYTPVDIGFVVVFKCIACNLSSFSMILHLNHLTLHIESWNLKQNFFFILFEFTCKYIRNLALPSFVFIFFSFSLFSSCQFPIIYFICFIWPMRKAKCCCVTFQLQTVKNQFPQVTKQCGPVNNE